MGPPCDGPETRPQTYTTMPEGSEWMNSGKAAGSSMVDMVELSPRRSAKAAASVAFSTRSNSPVAMRSNDCVLAGARPYGTVFLALRGESAAWNGPP